MSEADRHYDNLQTAVDASLSALDPLLAKYVDACMYGVDCRASNNDESMDMSAGLSLLLVRPQVLLASLHNLVITLALSLSGTPVTDGVVRNFGEIERSRSDVVSNELYGELAVCQEVMDKVRGMEGKLEYQIKKLMALAEEKRVEEDEEGKVLARFRSSRSSFIPTKYGCYDNNQNDAGRTIRCVPTSASGGGAVP